MGGRISGPGTLLGEIGLFTPDGRRTMTVRCKSDVRAAMIDYDRFKDYVEKFEGDLSPEQRADLAALGIDPDLDPDANKSR